MRVFFVECHGGHDGAEELVIISFDVLTILSDQCREH